MGATISTQTDGVIPGIQQMSRETTATGIQAWQPWNTRPGSRIIGSAEKRTIHRIDHESDSQPFAWLQDFIIDLDTESIATCEGSSRSPAFIDNTSRNQAYVLSLRSVSLVPVCFTHTELVLL